MIIVSYDISDNKMRNHFSKMLKGNDAIRLQYSVYEVRNTGSADISGWYDGKKRLAHIMHIE